MAKGSVRKKGKKWYYRFYIEDESGNRGIGTAVAHEVNEGLQMVGGDGFQLPLAQGCKRSTPALRASPKRKPCSAGRWRTTRKSGLWRKRKTSPWAICWICGWRKNCRELEHIAPAHGRRGRAIGIGTAVAHERRTIRPCCPSRSPIIPG